MNRLPKGLNIIFGDRSKSLKVESCYEQEAKPWPDWITNPECWNRQEFIACVSAYLHHKNGDIAIADGHLLGILAAQIDMYVECIMKIRKEGLVTTFNAGMTSGPNPCVTIADKALYRCVQIMKELELSPKSRTGYSASYQRSKKLQRLLDGP